AGPEDHRPRRAGGGADQRSENALDQRHLRGRRRPARGRRAQHPRPDPRGNPVRGLEKFLLAAAFLAVAALTVWLERSQERAPVEEAADQPARNEPDYYIENFVATGLDSEGRQYVMDAIRMAHFPIDDTSLIEQPHIIQYTGEAGPRHVYAETGL